MELRGIVGFMMGMRLSPMHRLLLGLVIGTALSLALMWSLLGPRPDLHSALRLDIFWMKFFYSLALAALGFVILCGLARDGREVRSAELALAVPVAAMIVLAGIELSAPNANVAALVMGSSWTSCSWVIALLSLPLCLCLMLALGHAARPVLAGAAAGLTAGAVASAIYGFHGPEMTAAFILIWHTLGIAISALLGAFLGLRLLAR